MDFELGLEILATLYVMVGVVLISIPKKLGLKFMGVAQVLWLIFGLVNEIWVFCLQCIFLFVVNLFAIKNWNKKGIG